MDTTIETNHDSTADKNVLELTLTYSTLWKVSVSSSKNQQNQHRRRRTLPPAPRLRCIITLITLFTALVHQ